MRDKLAASSRLVVGPRPKEGEMRVDTGLEEIQRAGEDLRYQFVSVELDLALTFVEVAHSRANKASAERALERAQEAYESATHFLAKMKLSPSLAAEIGEKLDRLESFLEDARPYGSIT